MDNSALNKAHLEYRRAEALLRSKKFLEAIKCHDNAAELLQEALTCTENARSTESMKLQRDFHIRQRDIILMQKRQYELKSSERNRSTNLPDAIHQTFEKTDQLLVLLKNNGEADLESLKSLTPIDQVDNVLVKHAKDKYVVVEELVTLNEQLHSHVYSLVEQLELKEREIAQLKERVAQLETDNSNKVRRTLNGDTTSNIQVIPIPGGYSPGGSVSSPYVFTPCSAAELSPVTLLCNNGNNGYGNSNSHVSHVIQSQLDSVVDYTAVVNPL